MSRQDFSDEVRKHESLLLRWVCALLGAVFTALGIVGIFLPVLPTTPFLLLAAACFARASERIHTWLLGHEVLGPIIREWRQHRSIPYRAKRMAVIMIVLSFTVSIVFFVPYWQAQLAMGLSGLALLTWFIRIPSRDAPGKTGRGG
ncbi:MAG TPA: YbaN family protein [Thiobacillaceae bacterium]|nr:YbaN family protein [Thiobacillaceae bacterium]HNU63148.1 YbaN family protein [Thiobacillaceae bacterium]